MRPKTGPIPRYSVSEASICDVEPLLGLFTHSIGKDYVIKSKRKNKRDLVCEPTLDLPRRREDHSALEGALSMD